MTIENSKMHWGNMLLWPRTRPSPSHRSVTERDHAYDRKTTMPKNMLKQRNRVSDGEKLQRMATNLSSRLVLKAVTYKKNKKGKLKT